MSKYISKAILKLKSKVYTLKTFFSVSPFATEKGKDGTWQRFLPWRRAFEQQVCLSADLTACLPAYSATWSQGLVNVNCYTDELAEVTT